VRWPIAALLGVTLVIASILFFARVSETEIDLDLLVSEMSFELPEQQVLTDDMSLSALGVSGLQEVQLPRTRTQNSQTFSESNGHGSAIRLSTEVDGQHEGAVTLGALMLPAGARIWLKATDIPEQYRLSIKSRELTLHADVNGPVGIGLPGTPPQRLNFLSPKAVLVRFGPNDVDLDIRFRSGSKGAFARQLLVEDLSLFHIEEHSNTEQTIVRSAPTVLTGKLYFESLGGSERLLRPGERIRFESSHGEVRTLELRSDRIAFGFHGQVRGMTTGPFQSPRSLMPTYLEWLRARHGLSLLWGTSLYLFGLIVSTLRWWRVAI
jgi:hypothetical protein